MESSRPRILIVDDHEAIRRGLRYLLSSRPNWEICGEAVDGIEGIEKAKSLRPDLILMDVSMPRMDGLQATRVLRKELPGAKVVIVSQNEAGITRPQAEAVNASAFVAKNDLQNSLLSTLDALLGSTPPKKPSRERANADSEQWLLGGGELGELIRHFDWSKTALGEISEWPDSLKTTVNLILNSTHPMWVGWGPDVTFLYNDAYVRVLGPSKHPCALGKPAAEVWSEIWDVCGPLVAKVFQAGKASFVDETRLFMSRGEFLEETFFSFSYSPIRDESGAVAGLFCPSTEVSAKVISTRRLRTLSELSAHTLVQKTTQAACESVGAALSANSDDIPFALLYLIDEAGRRAHLEQICGLDRSSERLAPASVELFEDGKSDDTEVWKIAEVAATGESQVISIKEDERLPLGLAQQRIKQAVVIPITSRAEAGAVGVLVAAVSPVRDLDAEYRTFYELIAGQIATAIQNVRAAEEERQRLEALAELDRAKTTFFSNVSHEFRTPLTLMLGPVEELLSRSHTNLTPAAKSQLELVNRNGSRLLRLVNTLLDFSRIEAGRMQAVYQATDLAGFTAELASAFRSATERAGLQLEIDCPKLEEPVYVDRNMWEKIVLNLLSNAFKFTFDGKIAVNVQQVQDGVEVRVQDTGVGIPAQEIPRLFDRFHRIENTRSRTHEGSGIGLALVQELIKLHGGSVRAESVLGEGSTFVVKLPLGISHLPADRIGGTRSLVSTAMGAAPFLEEALRWLPEEELGQEIELLPSDELLPVPSPALPSENEKRPLILVADDNADMRQYLVRLLSERYEVKAVADGERALDAVERRAPDLVLTDVMMPNLDGFGLLRKLRSQPETQTIPIILLSARAGEESRVEGMEQGADDYLIKPFSARELLARVQTHLEMARVRKQAQEALRRRTEQFETLLNEAPLGVYLTDSQFRIRAVNPLAERVFGDLHNLVGRDFEEVIHILWPHTYADEITARFRHTLETGIPYVVPEAMEECRDRGVREIYEWQINRIALPEGGYGVVCYFRDISRQVLAREVISESEKQLRLATEAAEIGIWHYYPTEDYFTWENDRCYEVFGRKREDGPFTHAEFVADIIHEEDRAKFENAMKATVQDGARHTFQGRINRDCRYSWIEFTGHLERNQDGTPWRVLGAVLDITSRKLAEQREREVAAEAVAANAKFRAVFEQTPSFSGILALDGTVLDVNKLVLTASGYRAEDILGRPFHETLYWRGSETVRAKIKLATAEAAKGIPFREVLTYYWAGGAERSVDFGLHPIRDDNGKVIFLHPTGVDITELKKIEENYRDLAESLEGEVRARTRELEDRNNEIFQQAEQLRDLSSRLLQAQDAERRHIARELHDSAGQILAALGMSLSQLSEQAAADSPKMKASVEDSRNLVQQLSQEIRTMSYLLHPPLLDEVGLSEALRWYISGLTQRNGLQVSFDVSPGFERLESNMELVIFRLVQESLTNIHRHSGSKKAAIALTRDDQGIALQIRDQGKGISDEDLARIHSQGSGVGIRGMRERARQFGGQMEIDSSSGGTNITFQFPLPAGNGKTPSTAESMLEQVGD